MSLFKQEGSRKEQGSVHLSFSQTAFSPNIDLSLVSFEQFSLTSPHWMKQIHRPESNIIYAIFLGNPWAKSLFGSISTYIIISLSFKQVQCYLCMLGPRELIKQAGSLDSKGFHAGQVPQQSLRIAGDVDDPIKPRRHLSGPIAEASPWGIQQ
jgi:hypothetical protein